MATARKRIVAGNWKMNTTVEEAVELALGVAARVGSDEDVEVVLIPPACHLFEVHKAVVDSAVKVGAQNVYPVDSGAFTGEMSGPMLRSVGCEYVVCGHSERRAIFGESPSFVGDKVGAAHRAGLTPILCVGETLDQRELGKTEDVVAEQLDAGLAALSGEQARATVVAYEPVWAIGTGRTATPEQAQEVHAFLRERLRGAYGAEIGDAIRIQYGGSVKPGNAADLLSQPDIDGALVGGASLKAESFVAIIGA